MLFGVGTIQALEAALPLFAQLFAQPVLNMELKLFACPGVTPMLSPGVITDREAVLLFDDGSAAMRWGIMFEDRAGAAFLARWFDDLWTAPASYLVFSRNGFDQSAVDRLRAELESLTVRHTSGGAMLSSSSS